MRAPPFNVADYLTDPETTEAYINELRAEIAKLRSCWLKTLAHDNACYAWQNNEPIPCHAQKCGCLREMQHILDQSE